jgi:two-component system, sensor histidine kinase ChiS
MQRKIATTISVLLIVLAIFSVIRGYSNHLSTKAKVEEGELHLTHTNKIMDLTGEWEFYQGELIDSISIGEKKQNRVFTEVPKPWDSLFRNFNGNIKTGTYRMTIYLPKDGVYGLKVNSIRYANKVFLNGVEVGSIGNPTQEVSEYKYSDGELLVFGESENRKLEVVIHAASHLGTNGGIVKPIQFGEAEKILLHTSKSRLVDGFIVSGYLILSILYFFLYTQQRKSKNDLYFAIFCLTQSIYVSTQNEKLIHLFIPAIQAYGLLSIQLVFIHLSVMFFLLFIHDTFRPQANPIITKWLMILLTCKTLYLSFPSLLSLVISLFPEEMTNGSLVLLLGSVYVYILYILIKAYIEKVAGSEYIMVATISFTCYGLALELELLLKLDMDQIPILLFLIMSISFSLYMGFRRQIAYTHIDNLSKELIVQEQLKNEFLLKTSNKIKYPLKVLMDLSNTLMAGGEGPLNQKQQEFIHEILHSGKKIMRLVKSLLNAKSGSPLTLDIKPINLKIITEMINELTYIIQLPNEVKIKNQLPADLPYVLADEEKLKQIIYNLLDNAIKFTQKGEIRLSATVVKKHVQVTIEDTGIGIEEQFMKNIFDTFYQVPNGIKSEGIGIGLSIVKQFIKIMNGEIWAESIKGKGTCILFKLPIYEGELREKTVDQKESLFLMEMTDETGSNSIHAIQTHSMQQKNIVLAGAKTKQQAKLTEFLLTAGYSITAYSDEEALYKKVMTNQVDLVIIDLNMPNKSWNELSKRIRKKFLLTELPILILASTSHIDNIVDTFEIGANDLIQKPISQVELLSRVKTLLAMKESVERSIHNELSYYQAQITPHFLFNTLNTIIGLSYIDPDKTREALEHLSVYFRSKLDFLKHQSMVPLEDEVELVLSYLAIEKIRFGNQLIIMYDIDESINMLIPSMTIQPLVENAIQHGLSKKRGGGTIKLSIQTEGDHVKLMIEDNGVGMSKEKQEKLFRGYNQRIGFINPYTKVKLIKNAKFQLSSKEGEGTQIIISLPYGIME